jgi:hypothetical protein
MKKERSGMKEREKRNERKKERKKEWVYWTVDGRMKEI